MAKINLDGYYSDEGMRLMRKPTEPTKNDREFWSENGGVDDFRQVGWISMNTGKVWGLNTVAPENVPDMTPIFINVRGD